MDQGRRPRQVAAVVAYLALAACGKDDAPKPPLATPPVTAPVVAIDAAEPPWDEALGSRLLDARAAVAKAYLQVRDLQRKQAEGELDLPSEPLPALDFTTETGNAVVTTVGVFGARDPMMGTARFRIVHLADNPWELASKADGMMAEEADKRKYRALRYRPQLEHLARAKYAVFVAGTDTAAMGNDTVLTPAKFDGIALIYELETTKMLAGFRLSVEGKTGMKTDRSDTYGKQFDSSMLALEARAREQLWDALRTRAPSVKAPSIVDTKIDDD